MCHGDRTYRSTWTPTASSPSAAEICGRHPDRVEVFTIVEDGVVYLPAHRPDIVFETWENETSVIGSMPLGEGGNRLLRPARRRGESPCSDVVGWVKNGDSDTAELVLTEASTGNELARAPMPSGANLLMSVGEEFVYFLNSTRESTDYPSRDSAVWSWAWTTGQSPEQVDVGDDRVLDVKDDIWAIQHGDELRFEDSSGQLLSLPIAPSHRSLTNWRGLSPDGAYWYDVRTNELTVTATGGTARPRGSPRSTSQGALLRALDRRDHADLPEQKPSNCL